MRRRALSIAVLVGLVVAACASPTPESSTTSESATSSCVEIQTITSLAKSPVVGLVALGHSGLTGFKSDPGQPNGDAKENSWATGTNPQVNSVYQRLVAARPDTEGHVANRAVDSARAATLIYQAQSARLQVPTPELVLIQTIGGDIRCDGTDDARLVDFGASLTQALNLFNEASPETRILIVSHLDRPATLAEAVSGNESAKSGFIGHGPCDFFDPATGKLNEEHISSLTDIIESYEAVQIQVCSEVPNCSTDSGAFSTYRLNSEDLVPGDGHLSVIGHARAAETIWPTVAQLLSLE